MWKCTRCSCFWCGRNLSWGLRSIMELLIILRGIQLVRSPRPLSLWRSLKLELLRLFSSRFLYWSSLKVNHCCLKVWRTAVWTSISLTTYFLSSWLLLNWSRLFRSGFFCSWLFGRGSLLLGFFSRGRFLCWGLFSWSGFRLRFGLSCWCFLCWRCLLSRGSFLGGGFFWSSLLLWSFSGFLLK